MNKKYLLMPALMGVLALASCDIAIILPGHSSANHGQESVSFDTSKTEYENVSTVSTSIVQSDVTDSTDEHSLKSLGNQNILVIPVTIKGYEKNATAANKARLEKCFFGDSSDTSWESLSSYYKKSSYGKLNITGTVSDWFACGYTPSQIASFDGSDYNFSSQYDPTWTILEEAVAWYKKTTGDDCKQFDNDGDGYIDGIWLVYSAPDYSVNQSLDSNVFWAYTFADYEWEGNVNSPVGYHYCWGSYDFMDEGYGKYGIDAHTFIHETGHLMGLDDYYDYNNTCSPMGYVDMMDANVIDHCAYSKFALGWIEPYLVSDSTEIVLKPSSTSGQAIILPTNGGFNGSAFDEYIMMEFYTPDVLNSKDSSSPYSTGIQGFTERGVRIYHVDARLATSHYSTTRKTWSDMSYTDTLKSSSYDLTVVAHTNTVKTSSADSYNYLNPSYRLIQLIDCSGKNYGKTVKQAGNSTLFQNGDTFSFSKFSNQFPSSSKMNDGTSFDFTVSFSNMTGESIKVTISKA